MFVKEHLNIIIPICGLISKTECLFFSNFSVNHMLNIKLIKNVLIGGPYNHLKPIFFFSCNLDKLQERYFFLLSKEYCPILSKTVTVDPFKTKIRHERVFNFLSIDNKDFILNERQRLLAPMESWSCVSIVDNQNRKFRHRKRYMKTCQCEKSCGNNVSLQLFNPRNSFTLMKSSYFFYRVSGKKSIPLNWSFGLILTKNSIKRDAFFLNAV